MARYIDADAAVEEARLAYCKDCNSYNGVKCRACEFDDAMSFIEGYPAADVVPKSEVAREIFDGLEKLFYNVMGTDGLQAVRFNPADYADFKKKYTEGKT